MKTTSTLIPLFFAASTYAHGILHQITSNGQSFLGNGVDRGTPFPSLSAEFPPKTLLRAPIIQHSTVGLMLNEILQRALSSQADSPHPRNSRQQKPKPINQEHTGTETWGQVG